jgi:hypothetical protein
MWKGTFSPNIFTLHEVILIAPLASKLAIAPSKEGHIKSGTQ